MSAKEHGLASPIVLLSNRVPIISKAGRQRQKIVAFNDAVKEDFALPDVILWALEHTVCFIKLLKCVEHLNVGCHARRCYGRNGNVALAR